MKKIIMFALIILSACVKEPTKPEPPPPSPTMNGTWEGKGTKNNIDYTITVTFTQTDTIVTGSGNLAALFLTIPFNAVGSNVYPRTAFTFANLDSTLTGNFSGVFDSTDNNKVVGAATVPSFQIVNEPLTIIRTE